MFAVEFWILSSGIRNTAQGNSEFHLRLESESDGQAPLKAPMNTESSIWNLESTAWNPELRLSWIPLWGGWGDFTVSSTNSTVVAFFFWWYGSELRHLCGPGTLLGVTWPLSRCSVRPNHVLVTRCVPWNYFSRLVARYTTFLATRNVFGRPLQGRQRKGSQRESCPRLGSWTSTTKLKIGTITSSV